MEQVFAIVRRDTYVSRVDTRELAITLAERMLVAVVFALMWFVL